MKKSIKIIIAVLVLIVLILGAAVIIFKPNNETNSTSSNTENLNPSFTATVLETEPKLLVRPDADTREIKSCDEIYVSTSLLSTNPLPDLKVGEKIRVVYNGEILESYPAQIINVFAIYEAE